MSDLTPLSDRLLQRYEVALLAALYFPFGEVEHAIAVAFRESGFRTGAHNTSGEDSRGLMQINVGPGAHPQLAAWNLFDPQVNMYFAGQLFREQGWRPWYAGSPPILPWL